MDIEGEKKRKRGEGTLQGVIIFLLIAGLVIGWRLIKLLHSLEQPLTGWLGRREEDIPRVQRTVPMLKQLWGKQKVRD